MKLHPSEQNSVTDIFKSKCPPDVILEVKVQKIISAYFSNLGQRSILASKGTFLWKKGTFFEKKGPKIFTTRSY